MDRGLHCLSPPATMGDVDILRDDAEAHKLLQLAYSGIVGLFWGGELDRIADDNISLRVLSFAKAIAETAGHFLVVLPAILPQHWLAFLQETNAHCWQLPGPHGTRHAVSSLQELAQLQGTSITTTSVVDLAALVVSEGSKSSVPWQDFQKHCPATFQRRRPAVCDGAGLNSSADKSVAAGNTSLSDVAQQWLQYLASQDLFLHLVEHLHEGRDAHPFTDEQQARITDIAHEALHPNCKKQECTHISQGQPFRLQLLQLFATATQDPDTGLCATLEHGVSTGIFEPIESSVQWVQQQQPIDDEDLDGLHLLHCQGNWTQAEKNPQLLEELVAHEVSQGWVKEFDGTLEDAERRWPQRTAVGKLNIVTAEGRDPRLVLDSSVCNANAKSKVPEKLAMPSGLDVARTFQPNDPHGAFVAVSLDFKAAHKGIKLRTEDQGCMLFRIANKLYHYVVCHFGAKFSAYWWQRLGAMLLRITHALLGKHSHRAWIYVDDLLALLARTAFVEQLALMVCFLTAIHAPISWKKAQLGHEVTWCGWTFNFDFETVQLAEGKLEKLQAQLQELAKSRKIPRKLLERALGLLMWATTTCTQLRPYLAPLYRDLHSGKGTLHSIHASSWHTFLDALDDTATVRHRPAGMWLPLGAKLLEIGSITITGKQSVPRVPPSHKPQWVRLQDPNRNELHLRNESRAALLWLSQCFSTSRIRSLKQYPIMHCMAAADARADGNLVGIGGWISTSTQFAWFAEQWDMTEVRKYWPQLKEAPQKYIACFETLAQLALAMLAKTRMQAKHWRFSLPAACDNTSAEAGINKLFTTTPPLSDFLKLVATWSACNHVSMQITHIAGEFNTWADEMSRNKLHRFSHRMHERSAFPLALLAEPVGIAHLHPDDSAWHSTWRA